MLYEFIKLANAGWPPKFLFLYGAIMLLAMTLAFSLHEFMHAFVADKCGDPTPFYDGRLTLNPAAHVDPMGLLLIFLVGFGWGKPVMVNPSKFNKFQSKRGMRIAVAVAGVTVNFLTALVCSIILTVMGGVITANNSAHDAYQIINGPVYTTISLFLVSLSSISMSLCAFNLIPIMPLDGSKILLEFLPYKVQSSAGFRNFLRNSPMILFALCIVGRIGNFSIIGQLVSWIAWPFQWIINTICSFIAALF